MPAQSTEAGPPEPLVDLPALHDGFGEDLVFPLQMSNLALSLGAFVNENGQPISCLPGCHTPVPAELEAEKLCVLHYLLKVEHTCAGMRRETVIGGSSAARRTEIAVHVKGTAEKLSRVAVISPTLTDEMKKRVLTTFLTLMNLQESLDRSTTRNAPGPESVRPAGASPLRSLAVAHG